MSNPNDLTIEIKFDGATSFKGDSGDVETKNGAYIRRIQVDQRLDSPDYFSIQVHMMEFNKIVALDSFKPGSEIEIIMGYGTEGPIFKGEISYIEPHFAPGEAYVTISGYHFSHRLTRGVNSRTFGDGHKEDQSPTDVASSVVGDSQARKGNTSDGLSGASGSAATKLEYISQYNQTDYHFVQQLGGNFGGGWNSESHADAKKLNLKALEKGAAVVKICRDQYNVESDSEIPCNSASFRLSTVKQVARVEVRGWDTVKKEAILGFSEALTAPIGGDPGHEQAGMAHYQSGSSGTVLTVVDLPVGSKAEADEIAQSIMDKLGMDWMSGDVVVQGRSDLHAGVVVEMSDFGVRYSGEFFVEACQHVFVAGSSVPYRCFLKIARNASPKP